MKITKTTTKELKRKKITISSFNVNGIRACISKGLLEYIKDFKCDIFLLQEIKALEEQIPIDFLTSLNNLKYSYHFFPAQKKGYSGVAAFIKQDLEIVNISLGMNIDKFDIEGRTICIELPELIVFGCYFPNGQRDLKRVPYKLNFSTEIQDLAISMHKKKNKPVIITGDINTAHKDIDLANPKANKKSTGFLPEERQYIDNLLDSGFVDLFRFKYPTDIKYSWWTYRNNCRARNIGWRIDSFFATKDIIPLLEDVEYQNQILGSDHCPILLKLSIPS